MDFQYIAIVNFDESDNFAFSVHINVSSLNSCIINMELAFLGCTHIHMKIGMVVVDVDKTSNRKAITLLFVVIRAKATSFTHDNVVKSVVIIPLLSLLTENFQPHNTLKLAKYSYLESERRERKENEQSFI